MSNELLVPNAQQYNDDILKSIVNTNEYFPRIQLCGSGSDIVKEGKIGVGRYALIPKKNEFVDLSQSIDVVPLVWRPLAMRIDGDNIITSIDRESQTWKEIQNMADNGPPMNGNMYGIEFLVYLAKTENFATLFCANKTQRRVAGQIISGGHLQKFINLGVQLIDNGKNKWHGSTFQAVPEFAIPSVEIIQEAITRFNNLKPQGPELATESNASSSERR